MNTYRVVLPSNGFNSSDYVEADSFEEDGRTLRFFKGTVKVAAYYEWLSVSLLPETEEEF